MLSAVGIRQELIDYRSLWILAIVAIWLQWIPTLSPASKASSFSAPLFTAQKTIRVSLSPQEVSRAIDNDVLSSRTFSAHHPAMEVSVNTAGVVVSKLCSNSDSDVHCGKGAGHFCDFAALCCVALLPMSANKLILLVAGIQYRAPRGIAVSTLDKAPPLRPPPI